MGDISKNFNKGGQITDLNEIVRLASEKKSIVIRDQVRPAAFIQNWMLRDILKSKIYYAINDNEITEIEFEEIL